MEKRMRITKAEFVKSAATPGDWPNDALPHIALVGRSNVGKSSLINCLANNFKLARTSNIPGKTRLINFYLINDCFYIVDLPGYGFAGVSKSEKDKWGYMIEEYLSGSINIALLVQLVDIRHKPTADDEQMIAWMTHFGFEKVIVASKADKLSKNDVNQSLRDMRKELTIPKKTQIIPFSAKTRLGKEELLNTIAPLLPG